MRRKVSFASIPPLDPQNAVEPQPSQFPPALALPNNNFLVAHENRHSPLLNNYNINPQESAHDHHPVLGHNRVIANSPQIDDDRILEIRNDNVSPVDMGPANNNHRLQNEVDQEVRALLSLPPINIPPNQRMSTPQQMSCQLMEHQKVGLSWLLGQEEDKSKMGGLLAGMLQFGSHPLTFTFTSPY